MPKFFITVGYTLEAESYEEAEDKAAVVDNFVEDKAPHAYAVNY